MDNTGPTQSVLGAILIGAGIVTSARTRRACRKRSKEIKNTCDCRRRKIDAIKTAKTKKQMETKLKTCLLSSQEY
jgi:hypothetical protein